MARFTQCARATGVSFLHFETVGPTVPCPGVPGRFDFLIACGGEKGRCFVCSDDNADDAKQKGRRETKRGFRVCGDVGDGDTGDNCNGALNCWFCC